MVLSMPAATGACGAEQHRRPRWPARPAPRRRPRAVGVVRPVPARRPPDRRGTSRPPPVAARAVGAGRRLDGVDRDAGVDGHAPVDQGLGRAGRPGWPCCRPGTRRPGTGRPGPRTPWRRGGRAAPSRCMRLPGWWAAAISTGKVAAALRSSTPPAWIPPTSGSTSRSTTGRPSRSPDDLARPTGRRWPVSGPRWGTTRSLATRSDSAGLEDARPGQRPPPGGDAEVEAVGHGPEPAPGPDGGAGGPHRDQLVGQPELVAQLGGLGPAGQEGVGGQVDRPPGELGRTGACRRAGRPPRAR